MQEPKIKPQLKLLAINYVGKCNGNIEKAALAAGYSANYARAQSYKLLARSDVQAYIKYLHANVEGCRDIMEIGDIQEFWSKVVQNKKDKTSDRLRASELLAKSKGAFINEW